MTYDLPTTGGRYNAHSLLWLETETDAGKALLVQVRRAKRPDGREPLDTIFLPICPESAEALRQMAKVIDDALHPEQLARGD